jgi:hypothetical protein
MPFVPGEGAAAEEVLAENEAFSAVQAAKLKEHLSQLAQYGKEGYEVLDNGDFRYYGAFRTAKTAGEMAGSRLVRQWDPETGYKATWLETYDSSGAVRVLRVETGGPKIHFFYDAQGNFLGEF